jgi:hypothetical protein
VLPGDERHAEVAIENLGVDPVRYSIAVAATNEDGQDLRHALVLRLAVATPSCVANAGERIYEGSLATAGVGDPRPGSHPGDRTLDPAGRETVCVTVHLPMGTSDALQDAETTVTFSVHAERPGLDR